MKTIEHATESTQRFSINVKESDVSAAEEEYGKEVVVQIGDGGIKARCISQEVEFVNGNKLIPK